mmetsp:Transcript_20385/g.30861  ORF Transcript_20385/g.30861 Transcript_20385/m.30861 type:complete len:146 (-) Transcript_20385:69-506(-)|eukprot:CAMPEP_0196142832 /NCGR_PEP_ID=MMETSP0910-20130528/12395_1 /TAXON_ID=49265 /ORGANISM="Thalassiosira rotula, Strain GSO102" /LENGTH=145 /DNA_ID=CAMNT_0041404199 /DNA_START=84 /DNA_END=521 /DNA_ORIENTATION=-
MAEEIAFEDAFLNGNNEQHGLSQGSNQVSDGCTYDGTGSSASDSSEGESDESPESEKRHRRKKNAYTSDSEIEDRRYRPRKKTRRYKSSRYESDSESESESCNLPTIPDTALNNTRTNFRTDRSVCEVQASQSATMPLKKRQTHE